jgi:hypothetical protein
MSESSNSERKRLRESSPNYCAPSEDDVDVSLLEDGLRLTPWQRLIENDRALALVRMLEQAKKRKDGTTYPDP